MPHLKYLSTEGDRSATTLTQSRCCIRCLFELLLPLTGAETKQKAFRKKKLVQMNLLIWMRPIHLQLRSFHFWFIFFTYGEGGGGTVSKKDQIQFPNRADCKQDQTDFPREQRIKKRLLQKSEGNFFEQSPRWILRGIFWWIFQAFFLGKNRRKNPPKNPRQNSNRNLGVSRPKSTLQGSGLDKEFFLEAGFYKNVCLSWKRPKGTLPKGTGGKVKF